MLRGRLNHGIKDSQRLDRKNRDKKTWGRGKRERDRPSRPGRFAVGKKPVFASLGSKLHLVWRLVRRSRKAKTQRCPFRINRKGE